MNKNHESDIGHERSVTKPERLNRVPQRPLGLLSDYVTVELPFDIDRMHKGLISIHNLIDKAEHLSQEASKNLSNLTGDDEPLALFDVSMLDSVLRTKMEDEKLEQTETRTLLKELAHRRNIIPFLSYEGLIYANPVDRDPRSFLSGEGGREELIFYKIHRLIEEEFNVALPQMRALITEKDDKVSSQQYCELVNQVAIPLIQAISKHMQQFRSTVTKETFNSVRPYWSEGQRFQGPSGKFSASYFVMDAFITGRDPAMKEALLKKLAELTHYPSTSLAENGFTGQQDMHDAFTLVQKKNDFVSLARSLNDAEADRVTSQLLSPAENNRNIHIGLAIRYLAEDYKMGKSGTGGEPMKDYLENFRDIYSHFSNVSK